MTPDLLARKQTAFVLWRPGNTATPPKLIIGTFKAGTPPTLNGARSIPLARVAGSPDLYQVAAAACGLVDGTTYHYWFEVADSNVYMGPTGNPIRITDPTAFSVDWRLTFAFPPPYSPAPDPGAILRAAAVVRFAGGKLWPADADGEVLATFASQPDVPSSSLPPNESLVIYELATAWTRTGAATSGTSVGVGTFRDVLALVDRSSSGANFAAVAAVSSGAHLLDLGVNALELLPPEDTYTDRSKWGYATSNYFAPDFDLGHPDAAGEAAPSTALADLLALIRACHGKGIRFFLDAVMSFSNEDAYKIANYLDFHVEYKTSDPELAGRDGNGGDLWKLRYAPATYDPITGASGSTFPARRHMILHLLHWLAFFHVDGLRLDSVVNYQCWDFAADIRDLSRQAWNDRWTAELGTTPGADARFLVVGEELSLPLGLLADLDSLWNDDFKYIARSVILGNNWSGEPSFEWSVRKLIDCRNLGFSRGYQAVNYLGNHDVGNGGSQRLYTYLDDNGVTDKQAPLQLGFVCLLTAVGVPMILAGDEFGQPQEVTQLTDANKQLDAVNFDLMTDPWRADLFAYVSRLVKLRTACPALSADDTDFIHVDFDDGKRVLAWLRGRPGVDDPLVVVANFSSWGTTNPTNPGARYHVPNWPALPAGKSWWEVTQGRAVPLAWAGEEPLYPWEAKVYQAK